MHAESASKHIASIYRMTMAVLNNNLKNLNIEYGQHDFFYVIGNNQGITQKQLGEHLSIGKSTTAKVVKNLEKKGYIYKEKGLEDKRFYQLYLTEKGEEIFPIIAKSFKEMIELLHEPFSDEEYSQFIEYLKKAKAYLSNVKESRE